ncbi:uncharacterized protein LOC116776259 [Danaus plexippus]|uniref:uncharacterized protein LOC116776259 n=1 Tax=Danaus plexippus TaxID=13037 RepID=UPI002AB20215|nr:uncharacterized protein LOC116776259 [Danaus plexippus]
MASKKIFLIIFMLYISNVRSDSLIERSYEYFKGLSKNVAPSLMSILNCFGEDDAWVCAKEKAGRILDSWDEEVNKQRRSWQEEADKEVTSSGRSFEEMPSKLGQEIEGALVSASDLVQHSMARALSKRHDGIDSVSIETDSKKRMEKNRPQKSQLVQKNGKGVRNFRNGRGLLGDVWDLGEKALDAVADHAIESDNQENGLVDRSSVEEQRGKKKKKKKAILKLLILGAVLKAKIGTLLQILSFKLQVKFFIIALIGLGINLARFWVELKNKHQQQPQKVIYYEHAQHQHHYEHEEEPGWGPWSRSIEPEENEGELGVKNSPYRGQENNAQSYPTRPLLTLS